MIAKTVEIRDAMTFIPALAIKLAPECEQDRYLLGRAGYGVSPAAQAQYVLLLGINGGAGETTCDPYDWDTSTMRLAHTWLIQHFDELASGDVVDVEYVTGKTKAPKRTENERGPGGRPDPLRGEHEQKGEREDERATRYHQTSEG